MADQPGTEGLLHTPIAKRDLALGLGLGAVSLAMPAQLRAAVAPPRGAMPIRSIGIAPHLPDWMHVVADDLANDCRRALGTLPTVGRGTAAADLVLGGIDDTATGLAEGQAFRITPRSTGGGIEIIGATPEELRRGAYWWSRTALKLDPTWRWTGIATPQAPPQAVPSTAIHGAFAPFKRRGWFINDEDLLTEWQTPSGKRDIDYPYYHDVVNLDALDHVCETAARLGMNMMIPASLVDIFNPAEARLLEIVSRRGLKVSQHHIEPVGVSGFTFKSYWRARGEEPTFSFYSSRDKMIEIWTDSIKHWSRFDTVWALGLRGTGDRPAWQADPKMPRDDATQGRLISEAIAVQRQLIRDHARDSSPEMTTVLWAEGSRLLAGGHLSVPDDVIIVFADNSPGAHMQADFFAPRTPGRSYGIYYHFALWSSGPHLVQSVAPDISARVIEQAIDTGTHDYVLFNVSSVREFVLGLTLAADQVTGTSPGDASQSVEAICRRWYGPAAGPAAARVYRDFFTAYARDSANQRQVFLDGMLRQMGLLLLTPQPIAPAGRADATGKDADARIWANASLPDMAVVSPIDPANLALLGEQHRALTELLAQAEKVARLVSPKARDHFAANLLAQISMLAGLSEWVLALVAARSAGSSQMRQSALMTAATAIASVKRSEALATRGIWAHWYRGDQKMAIDSLIEKTAAAALDRASPAA